MKNDFTLENKKEYIGEIYGGEVGIILDGRGRAFNLNVNMDNRIDLVSNWSKSMDEFPKGD